MDTDAVKLGTPSVEERVINVACDILKLDKKHLTRETSLDSIVNWSDDSLRAVELLMKFEEALEKEFEVPVWPFRKVGVQEVWNIDDVIIYFQRRLTSRPLTTEEFCARYAKGEREFPYSDLRGNSLRGVDMSGSNLSVADFRGVDLTGAVLVGCDLNRAYMQSAVLHRAVLRAAKLVKAQLRYANASGADFSGADIREANFEEASLSKANLTGVLRNKWTSFIGTDLVKVVRDLEWKKEDERAVQELNNLLNPSLELPPIFDLRLVGFTLIVVVFVALVAFLKAILHP